MRAVICFTEKGWTCTLNPLDYCTWDILQELVYEGRREPFANLRDLQNVIRDKWHDVADQWSDNEKSYFALEKTFGCSSKAEWGTYSAHFLLISLTDDFCDDMT